MTPPSAVPSITWDDGVIVAIDQRALPCEQRLLRIETISQLIESLQSLAIRGAPAIGLAGALGVALSARLHHADCGVGEEAVRADAARLAEARPTAVNLAWGVRRALARLESGHEAVLADALAMLDEDTTTNRAAVRRAADLVEALVPERPLRVMTHCNTGRLATAAVGTALGTILELADRGRIEEVLVDETRPLLQGARLTAWELGEAGVPYRLCVDSAAAAAMDRGMVDCVLVGADRIAANGDTANKIGTYGLAVSAARHGIPFVVVAPESTWDLELHDGSGIVVEDRAHSEVTGFGDTVTAPAGAAAFNPAFDVTPAELITALVSEQRTVRPGRARPGILPDAARTAGTPQSDIAALLTEIPDHPSSGVVFRDLAGLYAEPGMLARLASHVAERLDGQFDRILAVESRGFVLGAALAALTGRPLSLARKAGKLPGPVYEADYALEYGRDRLEVQKSALCPGDRVLCVDDVLATGGTLHAAARLVTVSGARVAGLVALVALRGLGGRQRLSGHSVLALCEVPA
ncbi:S-methyl-5-thioribose-1-phosphate isomerase [Streptomyces sp. NPDC015680]|uniref:S-methyl-5-thioribose-1-phosphate isomerase n=1 Tax=Streptomyces sp. NPDC015680 TaxID=3364962 RepID=UPI0036FE2934